MFDSHRTTQVTGDRARRILGRNLVKSASLIAIALLAQSASTEAGYFLDFNSLDAYEYSKYGDQAYGATGWQADPIEQYIESVIGSNVWVYRGTKTLKYKPENVGPDEYLGNSDYINGVLTEHDGPRDTYLINRWDDGFDRITMIFDMALTSISFDWQIFPATQGKSDIKVLGDGVEYFHYDNSDNVLSGAMGHATIFFDSPVHKLEFVDWRTAPVGIDNLHLNCPPPPSNQTVPEPATALMALLGTLGIGVVRRRRTAVA